MPSVMSTTSRSIMTHAFLFWRHRRTEMVASVTPKRSTLEGFQRRVQPFGGFEVLLDETEHHVAHGPDLVHAAHDLTDGSEQQVLAVRARDPRVRLGGEDVLQRH